MARILFLTQVLPYPLNTGARVRQYYTLRHLSQRHEVILVSFIRADDQSEHIDHLKTICTAVHTVPMVRSQWRNVRAVARGLRMSKPFIIVRDEIDSMQQLLARLMASEHFAALHADQVAMAQYGLMGRQAAHRREIPRVLDLHNAMYLVTQRMADSEPNPIKRLVIQRETRALAKYEAELCGQFDQVVFVTDEDRRAIETQLRRFQIDVPADRLATIPICSDPSDKQPIVQVANPQRVTVMGVMFWPPNAEGVRWFVREAWPQVHAQFPQACLTIVGKNPPPDLLALNGHDHIEVKGYVPDLNSILSETAVLIVPLRAGGGMRVKILDTWCWGLPIVATSIGAEGIALRDGENILIANTGDELARAVSRVLSDPSLAQRLRHDGRRWVETQYDWHTVYTAWDSVYARLLNA